MRGDDRVRFCKHCNLNVYNLPALSRQQAEDLVNANEGRMCVSFYRRADGTVITEDCGGGLRFAARRAWTFASAAVATVACVLLSPLGFGSSSQNNPQSPLDVKPPVPDVTRIVGDMPAPRAVRGEMVMGAPVPLLGKIAAPNPPPPATQPTTAPATQPHE
jgi:hypothetical protein